MNTALHRLAVSTNLWERRVAITSTRAYIKDSEFGETLVIAERLLHDDEDLIHKAVGCGGGLPPGSLRSHAPDDASLRHRETS